MARSALSESRCRARPAMDTMGTIDVLHPLISRPYSRYIDVIVDKTVSAFSRVLTPMIQSSWRRSIDCLEMSGILFWKSASIREEMTSVMIREVSGPMGIRIVWFRLHDLIEGIEPSAIDP